MGGLRRQLPVTFWTFLIGSASLAALPLVTAGFYSKDLILFETYASDQGSIWLWLAGLVGAFLTSLYTFRMVFLTFFGEARQQVTHRPGLVIEIPLIVLAVLSVVAGFLELPGTLGNLPLFSGFLHSALPAVTLVPAREGDEGLLQLISGIVALVGIYLAYLFILRSPRLTENLVRTSWGSALHRFWFVGWGFDWLYDTLFVRPYYWLAQVNSQDVIDLIYTGIAWLAQLFYRALSGTETGQVRRYAMGIAIGAVITIALVVFL
jgi:NADH-quinone oxidoreductase subunit L